jgi:hypothetical protein
MTNIIISVYHLVFFAELIDKTFGSLEKLLDAGVFDNSTNEELRLMVQTNACIQILLYTDSLIEEYNKYFKVTEAKTDTEYAKVEQTRELLKPVFKKINQWTELKDFRNNVLAHNYRVQKLGYKSVFISKGLSGYNIPQRILDFAFLIQCIDLVRQIVYKIFKEEYLEILGEVDKIRISTRKPALNENRNYREEYEELRKEIWRRKEIIEARYPEQ